MRFPHALPCCSDQRAQKLSTFRFYGKDILDPTRATKTILNPPSPQGREWWGYTTMKPILSSSLSQSQSRLSTFSLLQSVWQEVMGCDGLPPRPQDRKKMKRSRHHSFLLDRASQQRKPALQGLRSSGIKLYARHFPTARAHFCSCAKNSSTSIP